ncbi:Sugar phosphate permease [Paenibacillaceae bacterium GAS479]|nr:Sugar phosphate permease [Paenibacillaceae bacterium GAS479]
MRCSGSIGPLWIRSSSKSNGRQCLGSMDEARITMSNYQKLLSVFVLSFGAASIFTLPYIKYVFYEPLLEALQATNGQVGMLLTLYAAVHLLLYIPGGWLADRFNTKLILVLSFISTGLLCIWFAIDMTLRSATIIWTLLGITTGFGYWAATIKSVRMIGGKREQGRLYGFYESFQGIVGMGFSFAALALISLFDTSVAGLKATVLFYGTMNFVSAFIIALWYRSAGEEKSEAVELADAMPMSPELLNSTPEFQTSTPSPTIPKPSTSTGFMQVLRIPQVWLVSLIVFASYGLFAGQTYFTPYMTDVWGMSAAAASVVAIIRTSLIRFVISPIGGIIADRIGSVSKVLWICNALAGVLLLSLLVTGGHGTSGVAITLIMLSAAVTYIAFGIMWAAMEEAGIPRAVAGSAVGIISIIGYLPDMFIHLLFGWFLDRFGSSGYTGIIGCLAGLCALGFASSLLLYRSRSKGRKLTAGHSALEI